MEKPFPQERELLAKTARLNELNVLLDLDKRESEAADEKHDASTETAATNDGAEEDPLLEAARRMVAEAAARAELEQDDELEM